MRFTYVLTPVMDRGALAGLKVTLTVNGTANGRVAFDIPERLRGTALRRVFVTTGAQFIQTTASRFELRQLKRRASISYVLPASGSSPTSEGQAPLVRTGWFAVRGEDALLRPDTSTRSDFEIRLTGFPKPWVARATLAGLAPVDQLDDVLLIGGNGFRVRSARVGAAPLHLVYPERLESRAEALKADASRVLMAERRFWRSPARPFTVAVVPLADDGDFSGRGVSGGMALFLGAAAPRAALLRLLAHENLHTWISRAIGGFPKTDPDLESWLNEGFTEAYTARLLLEAGLWTPQQFIDDWNLSLARYGTSPVQTAPNARILADRQTDYDVNKLPYDRGRLLAVLWDRKIREATSGRLSLDDVLRTQARQAARNQKEGPQLSADRLFPQIVQRLARIDLSPQISRYVQLGQKLALPPDVFGRCVEVYTLTQPEFDRGFDLGATLKAHGLVTGLKAGGPAEQAGLHDGDHISIDETPTRDSRVRLRYRVDDAGGRRRFVSYRPQGSINISFQQLRLRPGASGDRACLADLGRP